MHCKLAEENEEEKTAAFFALLNSFPSVMHLCNNFFFEEVQT